MKTIVAAIAVVAVSFGMLYYLVGPIIAAIIIAWAIVGIGAVIAYEDIG